jgi:predicted GNAT family N-acyltransferase
MKIVSFNTRSEWYPKALSLRYKLLRQPLGLQFTDEELEKEKHDLHFAIVEQETVVACLTLSECEKGRMKMRQVATDTHCQGKGLGKKLTAAAEEYAAQKGFDTMFCHARTTAIPFYRSMGYEIIGSEFIEVGIPHVMMEKKLFQHVH